MRKVPLIQIYKASRMLYAVSFPLIAKANSQACSDNFDPITIFESTRCELASRFLQRAEKRLSRLSVTFSHISRP